ncbi:MAG: hypothetical protein K6E85_02870 [Lachnospiraceae bacterium]|nr:hypothetical protein [Lachnospiraceae bacterium]
MKRILALLADGTGYSGELASYLSLKRDFIFKTVLFNNISELIKFAKEYTVDLLLCDERAESEIPAEIENVCFLCEDCEVMETSELGDPRWHRIFKYQSSEIIIKDIVDYYKGKQRKAREEIEAIEANKRIICVCSPIGGSYASTFALALAYYLSQGGKTLFISFDPFFEYPGEDKSEAEKNLTDLMYFMEVSSKGIADFITRISVHRGSLDYVSGVSHWFDIADMPRMKMRTILEELNSSGSYENIVFDLRIMGEAGIELMAGSKEIYVLKKHGYNAAKVIDEWKRQIRFANLESILEKVKEMEIPYDEVLVGEYGFDVLLKGHLGQFIEEMEGLQYCR